MEMAWLVSVVGRVAQYRSCFSFVGLFVFLTTFFQSGKNIGLLPKEEIKFQRLVMPFHFPIHTGHASRFACRSFDVACQLYEHFHWLQCVPLFAYACYEVFRILCERGLGSWWRTVSTKKKKLVQQKIFLHFRHCQREVFTAQKGVDYCKFSLRISLRSHVSHLIHNQLPAFFG